MIEKNRKLNQWLWKWHFIAGLVALPFVFLLAITGGIYLFKETYDAPKQAHIKLVEDGGKLVSFQEQWQVAKNASKQPPNTMVVPTQKSEATEFITGRFSHKTSTYIDPFKNKVTGSIKPKDSNMHTVRKLHGELLLGKFGTKIVELVASWLFVLIITGVYVFWPNKKQGIKGFFTIRFKEGKRTLYRDLHTVFGFWISILLLLTLAGGMPWTDVFGENFRSIQNATNTGFPATWDGKSLESTVKGNPVSLDEMVVKAKSLKLEGKLNIGLPASDKGVYSVFNETFDLDKQKRFHFDQYSGIQLLKHNWEDVGVLMRGRMWVMAFHQGQFGRWNWVLMLGVAILLTFVSVAGLLSYLKRKKKGEWGVPKVPAKFKVGYGIMAIIALLSVIFPLFGISVVLIIVVDFFKKKKRTIIQN